MTHQQPQSQWRHEMETRTAQIIGAHNLLAQHVTGTRRFAGQLAWVVIGEGLSLLGLATYIFWPW